MSTVAVIDEDGAMCALIREWLETAGYRLSVERPRGGKDIDLVIVDIPNLRLHGAHIVEEVRKTYPQAAVIGMSAQIGQSLPKHSALVVALGIPCLLAKPLGRAELLAATVDAIGIAS